MGLLATDPSFLCFISKNGTIPAKSWTAGDPDWQRGEYRTPPFVCRADFLEIQIPWRFPRGLKVLSDSLNQKNSGEKIGLVERVSTPYATRRRQT
jgi:hypothetical protein